MTEHVSRHRCCEPNGNVSLRAWTGYRHCGNEIYLDRYGRIRKLTGILRSRDRWRGLVQGLLRWRLDLLTDHSIGQYAAHIASAVKQEHAGLATNRARPAKDFVVGTENDEQHCENAASNAV